ncbi:uncharacterized protein LOC114527532 [Dendronephthya gigantea]|uniref:uncharacterized protein LOC114527532 n=1 Tax=Dendronephthya gigantea TaxID=151771 RepID=UPI00106BA092|nr:uncharacterized protein LOC114527532 [Dendronephthya gigantea]
MKRPTRSPGGHKDKSDDQAENGAQNSRKKRRRCGVCEPCLTKTNCETCSNCLNRRTGHQICKFRKCIELKKKTNEAASGTVMSPADTQPGSMNKILEPSDPTAKCSALPNEITPHARHEMSPKNKITSPKRQEKKKALKDEKTFLKSERKAGNSERKPTDVKEEGLSVQKAKDGGMQRKQEIQNLSPIEKSQSSEATDCHLSLMTSKESTNDPVPRPDPLSSNPENWCSCKVKEEGSVYKHLAVGSSVHHVRSILAERFNLSPESVRVEKVSHSGKEAKNKDGCPIARWVLRRSSDEEKILSVVRQRPGHTCEFSFIVISIVIWDGVPSKQADSLYSELTSTLNEHAVSTPRRCGMNKEKQCACQGSDSATAGASFSFGCSWNRYYNSCKFARSKTPRKFRLQNQEMEDSIDTLLQDLATQVAQTYKTIAPEAFENQTRHDSEGVRCRIGSNTDCARPFSGVTCCVDFCAHNHKDDHNMENGATVVLTLLGEDARKQTNSDDLEQIHSLPCYHLLDNNNNVVPPSYVIPNHMLMSPKASSPLKGNTSSHDAEFADIELNGSMNSSNQQFPEDHPSGFTTPKANKPEGGISEDQSPSSSRENVPRGVNSGYHNFNNSLQNGLPYKEMNGQNHSNSSGFVPKPSVISNGYNQDILEKQFAGNVFPTVQNPGVSNGGRVNGYHDPRGLNPGNAVPEREQIFNGSAVKQSDASDFFTKLVNGNSYPGVVDRWGNVIPGYNGHFLCPASAMNGFHSNELTKNGYHYNALVRHESDGSRRDSASCERRDLGHEISEKNSENNSDTNIQHSSNVSNTNDSLDEALKWIDDSMGGVGLALSHGSILIECAKQEVHATTRVKNPNRKEPTRLSLVFYQHRLMNFKNHGSEEYRKHQEQKKIDAEKAAFSLDGEFTGVPFEAFDLRMLAETALNSTPEEQALINRNSSEGNPAFVGAHRDQVNGTNYPSREVSLPVSQSDGNNIERPPRATNTQPTTSRSSQYPLTQTNEINKRPPNGSASDYLRSLKRKEHPDFTHMYPTFPYANTLPLTSFVPPIFLPPLRHSGAIFNPFTPAGRGSYHVLNSQHQSGPPYHELTRTMNPPKQKQNTHPDVPPHEMNSPFDAKLSQITNPKVPSTSLKPVSEPRCSQTHESQPPREATKWFDPKSSQNTNDYSVEALLGRKRSHSFVSSNNMAEHHTLKQQRLDQNGFSYLSSVFNNQPDIHTRVLGLPVHPELAMNYGKFPPYNLPYPPKTIFTGTTTYGTDSLVNMSPFAGTLVGGGHYQW